MTNSSKVFTYRLSAFSLRFGIFTTLWCLMAAIGNFSLEHYGTGWWNLFLSALNGFFVVIHIKRLYFSSEPVSIAVRNKEYERHVQVSGSDSIKISFRKFKSLLNSFLKDSEIIKLYINGSCLFMLPSNEILVKIESKNDTTLFFVNNTRYVIENRKQYEKTIYYVDSKVKRICEA